jgi:hypothetical protein
MPDCQAWGHPSTISADRLYYIPNQRLKKQKKNQLDACVCCVCVDTVGALSGMLRWLLCLDEKFIFVTS